MLVLGIDPGIAITGISLVNKEKDNFTLLYSTSITTPVIDNPSKRLLSLYENLEKIIQKYKPDSAGLENLFFNTNVKTALIVGQARGAIMVALEKNNIPVCEYTPLQVKMAITGYGRADKNQIQQMVKRILHLDKILKPDDVADASAIALTHCFSSKNFL